MNEIIESDDMPVELRLAAIVALLSASALRGPTAAKAAALRGHLEAAIREDGLAPELHLALAESLSGWLAVRCHPASSGQSVCHLTPPGQSLH